MILCTSQDVTLHINPSVQCSILLPAISVRWYVRSFQGMTLFYTGLELGASHSNLRHDLHVQVFKKKKSSVLWRKEKSRRSVCGGEGVKRQNAYALFIWTHFKKWSHLIVEKSTIQAELFRVTVVTCQTHARELVRVEAGWGLNHVTLHNFFFFWWKNTCRDENWWWIHMNILHLHARKYLSTPQGGGASNFCRCCIVCILISSPCSSSPMFS